MPTNDMPSIRRGWFRGAPSSAKNEVVYAIGDIHGRFDLFWELIQAIEADYASHGRRTTRARVIVLGDFIDRGPDSRRLISVFSSLKRGNVRLEILMGNHEALLLDSLAGDEHAQRLWLEMGGIATLASFGIAPPSPYEDPIHFAERVVQVITPEVIDWMRDLPVSARSGDYFFCHAGIRPGVPLKKQAQEDMLWIRKLFMESRRDHGAVIVHGHNIVDEVEVLHNRISIDTGAYRSDKLSAICIDGARRRILTT